MTKQVLNKIMYVEDEADIRTIAKMALEDLGGFSLQLCENGKTALACLTTYQPQLIILDMMMPEMDGKTTLTEIRKVPGFEKTPIVFMTARAQQKEIEDYLAAGAIDVILKPFDPIELPKKINAIWKRHHG